MFGQPETENLFLNRSDVIYDTTDKKNLPPEMVEFILVRHIIQFLPTIHCVQYKLDICDGSSAAVCEEWWHRWGQIRPPYTQLIEYLLRIATTAVITPHVVRKKLYENCATTRLQPRL